MIVASLDLLLRFWRSEVSFDASGVWLFIFYGGVGVFFEMV